MLEAEGQTESDSHSFIKSLRYEHHVHVMQLSPGSSFALCVCSGIQHKRQTRTPRKEIYFLPIRGSVSPQSTCRKVSGATSLPSLQREPLHCVFTQPCFGANTSMAPIVWFLFIPDTVPLGTGASVCKLKTTQCRCQDSKQMSSQ